MSAPIIHICGWPGSGKATIGRILAQQMRGRLIDNHLTINPASALFDRADPRHAALRLTLRQDIDQAALTLPPEIPLIVTDALASTDEDLFNPTQRLAQDRKAPLHCVTLEISASENARRLQNPARQQGPKLTDPDILAALREEHSLLRPIGAVSIDVTALSAKAAADQIHATLATS